MNKDKFLKRLEPTVKSEKVRKCIYLDDRLNKRLTTFCKTNHIPVSRVIEELVRDAFSKKTA